MKKIAIMLLLLMMLPSVFSAKEKISPQHIVKIGDKAPDFTIKYVNSFPGVR